LQRISGALEDDNAVKRITFFKERSFTQPAKKQTELKIKVVENAQRKPPTTSESAKVAKKTQPSTRKKAAK